MGFKQKFGKVLLSLGVLAGIIVSVPGSVLAAGTAVMSTDGPPSVTAGAQFAVGIYVTPSGASVYSGEVSVALTNAAFVSYAPGASPFTGLNAVMSGNTPGSTGFTVAFSYIGAVAGSSGRALIGTVTLQAGASGPARINLSGQKADDGDGDPMAPVTVQNRTVTVAAAPTPTCPAGQIGTYPDCKTPPVNNGSPNDGGGTGSVNPRPSNPSNPVNTPNPGSTANRPDAEGNPQTVSEEDFSKLTSDPEDSPTETVASTTQLLDSTKRIALLSVIGLAVLLFIGIVTRTLLVKAAASRALKQRVTGVSMGPVVNGVAPIAPQQPTSPQPTTPAQAPQQDSDNGPTIIRPQQQ